MGSKAHRPDPTRMPLQRLEALARAHLPQLHGPVVTPCCETRAVGAEGDRRAPNSMPLQRGEALPRAHLPQPYRSVVTATGKASTIGAKSHRPDLACMAL